MFKILDKAQKLERSGRDILHFELGEPNFDTPGNIVEAACSALRTGETHYTDLLGQIWSRVNVRLDRTQGGQGHAQETVHARGNYPTSADS